MVLRSISVSETSYSNKRQLTHSVRRVLIHARGCTAVKLVRIAQQNDIEVVLVQSDPDMDSVAADMLGDRDELVCIGGNTADESYLNAQSVLSVAEHERGRLIAPWHWVFCRRTVNLQSCVAAMELTLLALRSPAWIRWEISLMQLIPL